MMRTFVIGDAHGHFNRLAQLLKKAGLPHPDVRIVQLGDLGHFDHDSQRRDYESYKLAYLTGMIVLWGNHDRAVVDPDNHAFRGFEHPGPMMQRMVEDIKPQIAYAVDGYLLTHAGLRPVPASLGFTHSTPELLSVDLADWLNEQPFDAPIINDIGRGRGGMQSAGGVLWRDAHEPLDTTVDQVFGHSKGLVRKYGARSYCIDCGDKTNGVLVGMWLDTQELVAVGPDPGTYEMVATEE